MPSVVERFARLPCMHRSGRRHHLVVEFICPALPLEGLLLLLVPFIVTSLLSGRVTLLTMTAMNVDILLALFLGLRYKQVVTVRRVRTLVVTLWVFSISVAVMIFYTPHVAVSIACAVFLFCIIISASCYTKIYGKIRPFRAQRQDQGHRCLPNGEGI